MPMPDKLAPLPTLCVDRQATFAYYAQAYNKYNSYSLLKISDGGESMTPEELLQECETLAHHGRMYRMVELGRLAVQDASIRELIATLTGGNVYERTLALQSCNGSRNSTQALQALSDPSRSVRSLALSLVPMLCSDTEIQSALDTISNDLQVVILTNLARRRRQEPINMYIEALAARQDAQLKRLLPFASLDIVTRHLRQVIDKFELDDWKRLTRSHPSFASTQLRARINASDTLDQQFILPLSPDTKCDRYNFLLYAKKASTEICIDHTSSPYCVHTHLERSTQNIASRAGRRYACYGKK
jgi:hypothetical protein